jgi:predicted anti-sigma-YlaC factor YlaD
VLGTAEDTGDVDFLYWKAAGVLAAFAIDPFDYTSGLGAKLPECIGMLNRAYELAPDYNNGALDELLFRVYAALPAEMGGDKEKAKTYFERALAKTGGLSPGLFITWAQSFSIPSQNYAEYRTMLERALAINPRRDKANTLAHKISQKKARWLLDNAGHFFIETDETPG